ncbi:Hypothetical protein, putative [Bodo saltans]|uniref:Uncharacterized protein n=1 Tax=Bodo saltans TaxID=75058 RepID=A0A0S4J1Q2_BODSA|nr:Hypothetical protein, putative [Bodo saltans]|eukprot:CUG81671.1 Hypothetical protein, putative [Bodo saltans]
MEVNAIATARQLEQSPPPMESTESRVRARDRLTINAAMRQVMIERMSIVGRPSEALLGQFLEQLDGGDVDVLVNMMKYALKAAVRSYRYVMLRFRAMVRASKCIRLFWLGSRFRFSSKLQRLILMWRRDEDEARKKLLNRSRKPVAPGAAGKDDGNTKSAPNRSSSQATKKSNDQQAPLNTSSSEQTNTTGDGDDDEFVLQQFISLRAPVELKRRVLMRHYKNLATDFRARWKLWRQKRREFDAELSTLQEGLGHSTTVDEGSGVHHHHHQKSKVLAAIQKRQSEFPPEPKFKWFQQLSSLSARERFEACLQHQLQRKHQGTEESGDDGWIALSLAACARHARQIEERAIAQQQGGGLGVSGGGGGAGPSITYLPRFNNVKSKVMDLASRGSGDAQVVRRVNRYGEVETTLLSSSTVINATKTLDLKAELPTLSRFKSEPWNYPPRPRGHPSASRRSASPGILASSSPAKSSGGGKPRATSAMAHYTDYAMHRASESDAMVQLDPMSKSLVLRGVLRPPARAALGPRSDVDVHFFFCTEHQSRMRWCNLTRCRRALFSVVSFGPPLGQPLGLDQMLTCIEIAQG